MVESPIPQDILKYKSKFIAGLSVRETVCGALGVGVSVYSYFVLFRELQSVDVRIGLSACLCLPFFLIGFIKLYDQPFEKLAVTLVMENFLYPPKRLKETRHPEFEKYEKTRYWIQEQEKIEVQEAQSEDAESNGSTKKKNKKSSSTKSKKKKEQKIVITPSATFAPIK